MTDIETAAVAAAYHQGQHEKRDDCTVSCDNGQPTPREAILVTAAALGLTMAAEFVPFSKSRNAAPRADGKVWRSLNWRVTILRSAGPHSIHAPREILTLDYSAGEAHAPGYRATDSALAASRIAPLKRARDALIAWEVENGKAGRYSYGWDGPVSAKPPRPLLPDFAHVLASLARDVDVLDAGGFESWASEYGYDTDSRSAEATYRACLDIALKLRAGLGEEGLAALRTACEGF